MKKTMRKIHSVLCIAIAAVIAVPNFFMGTVFGFYSDSAHLAASVATGRVNPVIENLRLESGGIEKDEDEISNSSIFLRINKSVVFSFTVSNAGGCGIEYFLSLQIAWAEELNESGKLFVYPYETGDDEIYRNLLAGDGTGAVIGAGCSDLNEIASSARVGFGISETVDSAVLDAAGESYQKDYKFRLFFYGDGDIAFSPEIYHNKSVEVNLVLHAVLNNRESSWAGTEKKSFGVITVIDTAYPVIREVAGPKTFFITQAQRIDLTAYAAAADVLDGDITDKIIVSSRPQFNPAKSGAYDITYTATNSIGNSAAPLHITVVVWDFAKITSGYYHTLALTTHGKVYVWGYNYYGQLGDGTYTDRAVPVQLEGLSHIIDVAAGVGCSFALNSDGQVYSWGRNENGRLGDGTTAAKNKPVKVAQSGAVKFVQISARFATAGGVTADGSVYTWGYGGYGAAGTGKSGDIHAPEKINLENIAQLELGYYNGAAVSKDGQVYTWGSNTYGQMGTGASASAGPNPIARVDYFDNENIKIKQVSAGYYHMTAVSDDGQLFTWGYGYEGRLGNGTTSNKFVPQLIYMPSPVKKALAAYSHTGVLTDGGTVYFFGRNAYGKHGSGNTTNHLTPYELTGVTDITDFSLAYDSSFVLSGSSEVYGMGYGGTGVLGTGNNSSSNSPVKWAFVPPEPY